MTAVTLAEAAAPLVLSIDIGSSSVRALLFDARARTVAGVGAHERYALRASQDGAAEDDADAAVERVVRCVDAALAQAGAAAGRIGAVALATLAATLVGLDADGRPLTPLLTYADTRNAEDAAALRELLDERAVHDRTGCMLRTSYWPARLAWLRRTRPEVWRRAARWVSLGEYLELRLFGRSRASLSIASWSGLLDRHTLAWDAPLLGTLGVVPEQLSPLADVDEPIRGLLPAHAARWPALHDIPWLPAVGDGAAANLGSGCAGEERIALTVGTTGALRIVMADVPRVPDGLWLYRVDRSLALLGGATSEGGNLYAWLRRTLRLRSQEEMEGVLAGLRPDGHGLTVLPFIAGERSPGWAGDARATIHGLTLDTTPAEILLASLEAIAYRFALILERLEERQTDLVPGGAAPRSAPGRAAVPLVASGGALLGSPAWSQIIADALGRTMTASAEPEATARGAALLALRALGAIPSLEALPAAEGRRYEPDPARRKIYLAAIDRQRLLYERLVRRPPEG